jgi:glutathione S-transferase
MDAWPKLYMNGTSPYARKVRVAILEYGLSHVIELIRVDPWADPPEFHSIASVGKVPALVLSNGTTLVDSTAICAFLDDMANGSDMGGSDRWDVMIRLGLSNGMIDAAFAATLEGRRPAELQWRDWTARQERAIRRVVAVAEVPPAGRFDVGDMALAVGLDYLSFRVPQIDWRSDRPDLAEWSDRMGQRESMMQSDPRIG